MCIFHIIFLFIYFQPKELLQNCKYKLDVENLRMAIWLPNHDEHSEWIRSLVCTLLECGLTRNNFYECVVPLCREEVIIIFIIYLCTIYIQIT